MYNVAIQKDNKIIKALGFSLFPKANEYFEKYSRILKCDTETYYSVKSVDESEADRILLMDGNYVMCWKLLKQC